MDVDDSTTGTASRSLSITAMKKRKANKAARIQKTRHRKGTNAIAFTKKYQNSRKNKVAN
ncbi:hypothetical protein LTR66_000018 [Elasticomyces elasticus]|nr:hypothetical protein LTR50_001443 [Elasticomyces elasticus]KAK5001242.1 hypothetical protein LTR66_000018 [Elasticomyces elasticus]